MLLDLSKRNKFPYVDLIVVAPA